MSTRFWHGFADMHTVKDAELVFRSGDGVWLEAVDGRHFLDATAALWYCAVGYGRKSIAEAIAALGANREQLSWMSRACRRRIRAAFSIERLAQEFSFHYARLIGQVSLAGASHARAPSPRGRSESRRETPEKLKD